MHRTAIVCSMLAACGTPGTGGTQQPNAPKPAACTRLAEGPPLVATGERMSYRLQLQGLELATYDFAVGDTADINGKQAIIVQSHAKAVGLVQMVAKVDDYATSWIDVQTGRPLRWATDEYATKGSDKEKTDARFFERANDMIPVDFHINDAPPKPEPQKVTQQDVWDYNSFLVALRTWDTAACSTMSFEVFRSRFMWHVDIKMRGKTKLVTAIGEFPAVRFDAHTFKLDRAGAKFGDAERDFSLWISDDDGRVPLQNVAATDYGDIKLEITDYTPGTGTRLRN